MMKEDWCYLSEWVSEQGRMNYVIMIAKLILTLCFSLWRINHRVLKNHLH
jgi:hypothetical protein